MKKNHPKNERIKRAYFIHLEDARRMSPSSVDHVAAALSSFETSTGGRDFKAFHIEQARKFKRDLNEQIVAETGRPLATATIVARLRAVKAFFQWLSQQPGYRSKIRFSDAEYFNPSANDSRIAGARRQHPVPSVEQIRHVVEAMPAGTEIEKRDRALIAFTLLSGGRDDAIASLSLKHVDRARRTVFFDAREVRTKNRKTYRTWFFPVGEPFEEIVCDWMTLLETEKHFGPDDPLFPITDVKLLADGRFGPVGLGRKHWTSATRIRAIFRQAFEAAGLPYSNPHSLRKTLTLLGERICTTQEEMKIWSQNLGHEHVATTFNSYGHVEEHRQGAVMECLRKQQRQKDGPGTVQLDEHTRRALKILLKF
ncbi:MAG TPA: tyrosine-type recombinase/integrase [Devosiaceae bacterium]